MATDYEKLLGDDAHDLLSYQCKGITADELTLPGPDYVDRVLLASDRPIPVVRNLASVYAHGRLGGTGYLSILPVDQGIEHSAGATSPRTRPTSIRPTSSSWLWRGGRRPLPPPWADWGSWPAATPTRSPSS